jgi:hypothetical protein
MDAGRRCQLAQVSGESKLLYKCGIDALHHQMQFDDIRAEWRLWIVAGNQERKRRHLDRHR